MPNDVSRHAHWHILSTAHARVCPEHMTGNGVFQLLSSWMFVFIHNAQLLPKFFFALFLACLLVTPGRIQQSPQRQL